MKHALVEEVMASPDRGWEALRVKTNSDNIEQLLAMQYRRFLTQLNMTPKRWYSLVTGTLMDHPITARPEAARLLHELYLAESMEWKTFRRACKMLNMPILNLRVFGQDYDELPIGDVGVRTSFSKPEGQR